MNTDQLRARMGRGDQSDNEPNIINFVDRRRAVNNFLSRAVRLQVRRSEISVIPSAFLQKKRESTFSLFPVIEEAWGGSSSPGCSWFWGSVACRVISSLQQGLEKLLCLQAGQRRKGEASSLWDARCQGLALAHQPVRMLCQISSAELGI